jgi:hypothetical protein
MWSVGLEPTKTASYTHRPVPILDYESSESSANLLTTTHTVYNLIFLNASYICVKY